MKQVRVASEKDSDKIADLRRTEYRRSKDFKLVSPDYLKWDETDKKCSVIGVFNEENDAIATMLMMVVKNVQGAVAALESDLPTMVSFPAFVLRRAATKQKYRKHGFNQLLRYYYIKAALNYNINSLLGPVYKHATRTGFMEEIGYQFHAPLAVPKGKLLPTSIRILAVLERKKMEFAIKAIEKKIPNLIKEYPWTGELISI